MGLSVEHETLRSRQAEQYRVAARLRWTQRSEHASGAM
jgi:hypothetical protein